MSKHSVADVNKRWETLGNEVRKDQATKNPQKVIRVAGYGVLYRYNFEKEKMIKKMRKNEKNAFVVDYDD